MIRSEIRRRRVPCDCEVCKEKITQTQFYMIRIVEQQDNLNKYINFHLNCAKNLSDLTNEEQNLLISREGKQEFLPYKSSYSVITSEKQLQNCFLNSLSAYERKEKLSFLHVTNGFMKISDDKYYSYGKKGCSDTVIFFPNGKTIFVELKYQDGKFSESQLKFQNLLKIIKHEYVCIRTKDDISSLFNKYCL